MQDCPGVLDQLLQVLDHFSTNQLPQEAELLYHRLSVLLRPWPQLLKDFAAFLNQEQAQRCGLVSEVPRDITTGVGGACVTAVLLPVSADGAADV